MASITHKYTSGILNSGSTGSGGQTLTLSAADILIAVVHNGAGSDSAGPRPTLAINGVTQTPVLLTTATSGATTSPTLRIYTASPNMSGSFYSDLGYNSTGVNAGTNGYVSWFQISGGIILDYGINNGSGTSASVTLPNVKPKSDDAVLFARSAAAVVGNITGTGWNTPINTATFAVVTGGPTPPDQTVDFTFNSSQVWAGIYLSAGEERVDVIGFNDGTTATSTGGTSAWVNPENVYSPDDVYTTSVATTTVANNPYLNVTNFNLSVPSAATIKDITVQIEAKSDLAAVINSIQLLKAGTPVGSVYTPVGAWAETDSLYTYDLGLGGATWTAAELCDSSFGVQLRYRAVLGTGGQSAVTRTATSVGGTIPWNNPEYAVDADSTYAVQYAPSDIESNNAFLTIKDLGFSIPSGASNISVTGRVLRQPSATGSGTIKTNLFQPIWNGVAGTNGAGITTWPSIMQTEDCQTSAYSVAQVNSSSFGFQFRCVGVGGQFSSTTKNGSNVTSFYDVTPPGTPIDWVNPTNVYTQNSVYTTFTLPGGSASTTDSNHSLLVLTDYNIDLPTDATILGVTASIRRYRYGGSTGHVRFAKVQLTEGGSLLGFNMANTSNFTTSAGNAAFGGTNNLWGATLTPSIINAADFGLAIKVKGDAASSNRIAAIDNATISIRYSIPGSKDAQVLDFNAAASYNIEQDTTVYVDSVKIAVKTQGAPKFIFGIPESGDLITSMSRRRGVISSITEAMTYVFSILVESGSTPVTFEFNISEMAQVAIAMARKRGVNLTLTEAESILIESVKRGRKLTTLIGENETIISKLSRKRALNVIISEAELITILLGRIRSAIIAINESESHNIKISRKRNVALNIDEVEELTVQAQFDRIKRLATIINETYAASINTITRLRKTSISINETENIDVVIKRLRKIALLINETEQVYFELIRNRGSALNINEVESVTLLLVRLRKLSASIIENESITFKINRLRKLALELAEAENMSVSLSRTIRMAMLITEMENIFVDLTQSTGFRLTISEQESVNLIMARARNSVLKINEFEAIIQTLSRIRDVNFGWDETESVGVFLGKLKIMSMTILQALNMDVNGIQRVRNVKLVYSEYASYLSAIERVRNMNTVIITGEDLTINVSRVRELVSAIIETQGITAGSISRIRGLIADITEVYGCDIKFKIIRIGNEKLQITALFNQWVGKPNGTLDLRTKEMTWEVIISPPPISLNIIEGEIITIDVPYMPAIIPELGDII